MKRVRKKQSPKFNHRIAELRPEGICALRVWSYPAKGKMSPYLKIKCGCCDGQVLIYHDGDDRDTGVDSLEINGVFGSVESWREVLLPLLGEKVKA